MSTLHRCLCYSQTSVIQTPKRQSVHITQVTVLQSNLLNTPPLLYYSLIQTHQRDKLSKLQEVPVLKTNLLNTDIKDTECPNYRGVCITVRREPVGTVLRPFRTERSIRNIEVSIRRESTALASTPTISLP